MIDAGLPEPQRAVHIECRHPTGSFVEFDRDALTRSIPDRFAQQARRYRDRIAVEVGPQGLSYSALDARASRVAAAIIATHTPRGTPVAIVLEQGPDFIAAMLGVLKAGHFYVPLDPTYPVSRLAFMLADSQAALLVTNSRHVRFAEKLALAECQLLDIDRLLSEDEIVATHAATSAPPTPMEGDTSAPNAALTTDGDRPAAPEPEP